MIRSLFFAPANRHDLVAKFPRFDADCVVIDLEDGTPHGEKESARAKLGEAVDGLRKAKLRSRLMIRINEPSSIHYLRDIDAALATDVDGVVIPKLEVCDQLFPVLHVIDRIEREQPGGRTRTILGGIESIGGVMNVDALVDVDPRMDTMFFGAEDFISDMGGRRTPIGNEVLYARSRVVIAARSRRIFAIDQAVAEIRDDEQYSRDAEVGRNLGYGGKICVLPRQVGIANSIFSPSDAELARARRLIDTYSKATAEGKGTIDFEGTMIDGPLLKRAEDIVALAQAIDARKAQAS